MTDADAIRLLLARHVSAANEGDAEAYAQTLAPDAIYMPPDSPVVAGKDAVAAFMNHAFFELYESTFEVQFDELETFGTSAFACGSFSLVLKAKDGGEITSMKGKFINIFRKQPDRSWKYAHAIWNLDGARV